MTESQVFEFNALVRRVAAVFRVRADGEDFRALSGSYFRALQRFELPDLERGADAWIGRESKFPKPAEWVQAIPVRVIELPVLTGRDAEDYLRAEHLRYEDAPCACRDCVAAEVHEKPLRFVPEVNPDGTDRKVKIGDRIVVAGHWAHGLELFRWYKARADFYNRCLELGLRGDVLKPKKVKRTFHERLKAIFPDKPKLEDGV